MQNFPRPNNKTSVRAFISLAGFYRQHIHMYSEITSVLNDLLKKSKTFVWEERHEKAFKSVKDALTKAVTLKFPETTKRYKLYTDASDLAIGAVLTQWDEELKEERPVRFLSRNLQAAELAYPTVEKELLAVVYSMKKLRKYLLDKTFDLYTDNTAVRYLLCKTDPSQRLQRWIMAVQEYQFRIYHIPGKQNVGADFMSRYPPEKENDREDQEEIFDGLYPAWFISSEGQGRVYEEYLNEIFIYLLKGNQDVKDEIKTKSRKYKIADNHLYRILGDRTVIIPYIEERSRTLTEIHEGHGHFGQDASWARLFTSYWWPSTYQDVRNHVKGCHECQIFSAMPIKTQAIIEQLNTTQDG
ncbi:hypothetical protein INT45_013585, partial [Circinella minor]